ncbi:leucyl/phenylalanyl-tRNA--protein transferase [Pseudomonas duriflava]|uniref:Leucyl/phenylalanyl-tRNA--protein transferase n=1 Tax=Pseudomonas duriflava TaxID=459528 RepID=A0A562Q1C9_9PSED|nr:leucyl/phenylalanyl-tRNA--protein transferase [Pseudomonas duriflava]TWI50467.1 leucyl/phenylalanyl-tRNA--protein transferase [Pseudomonas duriflava]
MLTWLKRDSTDFPSIDNALREPNGLLAAGGDLSANRLIAAYRHGCFPWFQAGQPILWWSPDPRTVLVPKDIHISRSLVKLMRQQRFQVSFDRDFSGVIKGCSEPRDYTQDTWITPEMSQAYKELHYRGIAHSVEVWEGDSLVGGLYGLAIGKLFFGESMFSRTNNASKVGFATLVKKLTEWEFALIDCQMPTQHLNSFGAINISRTVFSNYLTQYLDETSKADWPTWPILQE